MLLKVVFNEEVDKMSKRSSASIVLSVLMVFALIYTPSVLAVERSTNKLQQTVEMPTGSSVAEFAKREAVAQSVVDTTESLRKATLISNNPQIGPPPPISYPYNDFYMSFFSKQQGYFVDIKTRFENPNKIMPAQEIIEFALFTNTVGSRPAAPANYKINVQTQKLFFNGVEIPKYLYVNTKPSINPIYMKALNLLGKLTEEAKHLYPTYIHMKTLDHITDVIKRMTSDYVIYGKEPAPKMMTQ